MNTASAMLQPIQSDDIPLSERGPAPTRVVVAYGFWLFLLSDIIVFAALFAAYAVLVTRTVGGPSGSQLFNREHVFIETACLLASSFTCALSSLAIELHNKKYTYLFSALTFVLGIAFVALEFIEFTHMIVAGNGPTRSAFLSAFFALVGAHGIHVTLGLCWLVMMMAQVANFGFTARIARRLLCFSLFWHALDIVWIGVFTIVYLGAR